MLEGPESQPGGPGWVGIQYHQLGAGLDTQEIPGPEGTTEPGAVGRGTLLAGDQDSKTQNCSSASSLWGLPKPTRKLPEALCCGEEANPECGMESTRHGETGSEHGSARPAGEPSRSEEGA